MPVRSLESNYNITPPLASPVMQSSPVASPSTTHHNPLGNTAGDGQIPLGISYNGATYEHEDCKPYSPSSPSSQPSPQSSQFQTHYVNASTSSAYHPHDISGLHSGWGPSMADPRMSRPRSTYPVDPYVLPSDQRHSRGHPFYSGMDNGSYGMRRTPPSASPYSTLTSSDGYGANLPGQYPSNYAYAPLPSRHSIASPQPAANGGSRCEWGSPRCDVPLEDASPSGIARHLRQYHDVLVTDNRTRGACAWGARCGKDMFPSSFGKHIAECHLRNMTKQCPYCHADFARADTLSRHIKAFCPHTTGGQATTPSG